MPLTADSGKFIQKYSLKIIHNMPITRTRRIRRPIRRIRRRRYGGIAARGRMNLFSGAKRSMLSRPNVYDFKRKIFYENLFIVNSATPLGYAFEQKFSQLPNVTDFTNLYDSYMIKKIVVKMIPKISQHNLATTTIGNADLPQLHSVVDYDDATTPTSVSQLVEYQSHKMTRGNQIHTRVLVPKVELTTDAANAPKAFQWIDCDSTTVNHRGLKFWFNAPQSANMSIYYDMLVTVYFSCKNVL